MGAMAAKSPKGVKRPAEPGGPEKPAAVDEREVVRFVETVAERAAAELVRRSGTLRRDEGSEPGG